MLSALRGRVIAEAEYSNNIRFAVNKLKLTGTEEKVYQKILLKMRESVRANKIRFTIHALEEMDNDDLYKADVMHCILMGEIVHRQWDDSFQEYKYLVDGEILAGEMIEVVAKLDADYTVVITAYVL